jgi:hypothetical protein
MANPLEEAAARDFIPQTGLKAKFPSGSTLRNVDLFH